MPAVCLAVAMVYLKQATPIYTATSRLYVEQSGPKIIGEDEGSRTQSSNYLYTQRELMTSTPILAAAAQDPRIAG
jgi:polysaccharide biosynthesis transport protein